MTTTGRQLAASQQSRSALAAIGDLKRVDGMDWDVHADRCFAEEADKRGGSGDAG